MAQEIERKFLVADPRFLQERDGIYLKQGYIPGRMRSAARIRIKGDVGFITLKGETTGISRCEYEYEIPLRDAEEMLELFCAKPFIEKTRYEIEYEGMLWEVDVFHGENEGLVLAEVELEHEQQGFVAPLWIGEEVSHDGRYFNASLALNPYKSWGTE